MLGLTMYEALVGFSGIIASTFLLLGSAFLDSLGIAHEEGLISEENVTKPAADGLRTAAAELSSRFPPDDVTLYFSTLVSQDPDTWGGLADLAMP